MKIGNKARPVVLVTGSAGFIGNRLIEKISSDYHVIGFDIVRPEGGTARADWVECDLTEDASTKRSLDFVQQKYGNKLASVVHLAAYYDFSGEPSPMYRKLTVEGTRRLLGGLQAFQVEQFIFSSTLLAMEPANEGEIITEKSPLVEEEETWDYPRSKIEAERVIRAERGGIPAVILRIAGVYAEDCRSIPLAQQINRIHEKQFESYFFPGDTDHGQAFVHIDDLTDCFRRVIELRQKLGEFEVFLIAEPDVMSYEELQDSLGNLIHGKEWPAIEIPKPVAKAGAWVKDALSSEEGSFIKPWMIDLADADYPVEIARARERLGWEPSHRLRDTLAEMILSLERNPKRWYEINGLELPEEEKSKKKGAQEGSA